MSQTDPKSSQQVLQTLQWVRHQEFRPVPLKHKSKAADRSGFTTLDYTPPPDNEWHTNQLGIGVVTGPQHSGPVDVDLDCPEAIHLAPSFLPHTPATFGRKSKPQSHYLYRVKESAGPKRALFDPVEGAVMLELRGDGGHQTVLPGSIHETTGEPVEWTDVPFPDVAKVEYDHLMRQCKKIAAAILIIRHVWTEGQRNEACKHISGMLYHYGWELDEALDFIRAVMNYTGDDDHTRIKTVRSTYQRGEKTGKVTGSPSLSAMLGDDRVTGLLSEWFGSPLQSVVEEYNEKYGAILVSGKFRIVTSGVTDTGAEQFQFMTKADFRSMLSNDRITVEDKLIPKADIWLTSPKRLTYDGVCFRPGVEDTGRMLNLWAGWAVDPAEGDCSGWLELLRSVICGDDTTKYEWMLAWFANMVQHPLDRPMTAPVIIGRQGAGKSLLLSYMGEVLGPAYTVVTNEEHIHGKFNSHLATTLLLHSEEALYAGDRKHRGVIKSLITDSYRIMEPKGVDAYSVQNFIRLVLTSNDPWAAPVERDDRRFTVIHMEGRKIEPDLLKKVLAEKRGSGPAALFHHLKNLKYDYDQVAQNIRDPHLLTLKMENLEPLEEWWRSVLSNGQLLEGEDQMYQRGSDPWPEYLGSTTLYNRAVRDLKERNSRNLPTQYSFARKMNEMLGRKLSRKQAIFGQHRQNTITDMPPLAECREAFEKYLGHPIEWDPTDGSEPEEKPGYDQY